GVVAIFENEDALHPRRLVGKFRFTDLLQKVLGIESVMARTYPKNRPAPRAWVEFVTFSKKADGLVGKKVHQKLVFGVHMKIDKFSFTHFENLRALDCQSSQSRRLQRTFRRPTVISRRCQALERSTPTATVVRILGISFVHGYCLHAARGSAE